MISRTNLSGKPGQAQSAWTRFERRQQMPEEICEAIASLSLIEFWYDGGVRTVKPFRHGLTRTGSAVLRAYQIDGYTSSSNLPQWRLFTIEKMSSIRLLAQTFDLNEIGYGTDDRGMAQIHCQVMPTR